MKTGALLAAFAATFAVPALAAPADPHAGHHPAEAVTPAKPAAPAPAAEPAPMQHNCPMMTGTEKPIEPGKPSAAPGGPNHTAMGDKPMAPGMMHKCMMHESAPATPQPDAHKHE